MASMERPVNYSRSMKGVSLLSYAPGFFMDSVVACVRKDGPVQLWDDESLRSEVCVAKLREHWAEELKLKPDEVSLGRALRKAFWKEAVVTGIFKLSWGVLVHLRSTECLQIRSI
jgi:hypothetical protein